MSSSKSSLSRTPSTVSNADYGNDQENCYPSDVELGPIITALKLGTSMSRFKLKANKPEQKTFQLDLEEFKISWFRAGTGREEGKSKLLIVSLFSKRLLVLLKSIDFSIMLCVLKIYVNF